MAAAAGLAAGGACIAGERTGADGPVVAEGDTTFQAPAAADTLGDGARVSADSLAVYRMDEVLITASRLPSSREIYFSNVVVATRDDLAGIASSTAAEALTVDSGIGLTEYGSYGSLQTMSMRGGSSSEVVYLVDGIPFSDPQLAGMDLNWLPRSGTERVEAMKGAASSLYGSGAITGAVNLVSMDPMVGTPAAEVAFWNGSFGSRSVGASLRRALAGNLGFLGSYDYLTSDGWVANAGSRGEKIYAKISGLAGGLRVDLAGFRHTGEVRIPGDFPGRQNDARKFLSASISRAGDYALGADYYHSATHQTYVTWDDCGGLWSYVNDGTMDGVRAGVTRRSADRLAVSLDAGYEHRRIESTSVGEMTAHDTYGLLRGEATRDPWRIAASARLEKNSQFDLETALQVSGWLFAGDRATLFCKTDRSFIYPSFNDLYWQGPKEVGDPNLKPEHSVGAEAGVLLKQGMFDASVTGYYRRVTDMILWRTNAPCWAVASTNAQVTLKGAEVALRARPAEGVKAVLSYWTGRSTDDDTGGALEYRPANVFSWRAEFERAVSKHVRCGATLAGRTVPALSSGDQMEPPDTCGGAWACRLDTRLPGYSSALLYAFLGIDRGRVFVRINNLFDDRIVTSWSKQGLALPGRSYEAGLALELMD
jgi:outer membrane cobalamin receptor